MNQTEKQNVVGALSEFCAKMGSQNKAAVALGVSPALVSRMLKGDWNLIKDEMWRKVASGCGYSSATWNIVETRDLQTLHYLYEDAQNNGTAMAITGKAGTGKTLAGKQYCRGNKTAFILCCNEYWNKKMFLQELLAVMGSDWSGYTTADMMYAIVKKIKSIDHPLLILDEADKLNDNLLYFFITIYNSLEDHLGTLRCGLILQATSFLEKRINRGVKLNKKGYNEIYSRICRRFIPLNGVSNRDITMVCQANGLEDTDDIRDVIDDSEGDLRRVRRRIHSLKIKHEQQLKEAV